MDTVTYKATSMTPLLMHNPAGMGRSRGGRKVIPTPEEEAEASTYRLPDGQLYLKAVMFRASLILSGKGKKFGRMGASGVIASTVFEVGVDIVCPLVHPETEQPLFDYEVDSRRAVVQRQGIVRSRAKVLEWQTTVMFEFDPSAWPDVSLLTEFFNDAGAHVGVGDYRPAKGGQFGRYGVELVEVNYD